MKSKEIFTYIAVETRYENRIFLISGNTYLEEGKSRDDDHRAKPEDVAAFIDERIKPRPLPDSYPPGEVLKLSPKPVATETHSEQT